MDLIRRLPAIVAVGLTLTACAAPAARTLVDPFPLRFPLAEAGTLEIDGHIVGQPQVRGNNLYYATREGCLTVVVIPSRSVLWRFKADQGLVAAPCPSGDVTLIRDAGNVLYGLIRPGRVLFKRTLDKAVTDAVGIIDGGIFAGTVDGRSLTFGLEGDPVHEQPITGSDAVITVGPVPVYRGAWLDVLLYGRADGWLTAVRPRSGPAWQFRAHGGIRTNPIQAPPRNDVLFGDEDRTFYCLDAATGRIRWRRRLQGAPVQPAVIYHGTLAVAASNSVVYRLSGKGGSILSWESVPSRIIHPLVLAGRTLLISSASPELVAHDMRTGERTGRYQAPGPQVAGAVWSTPYVVLFVEDEDSGRQKIVFLRSR
jgi:outer membrane protein assembly factor BamB